jgi:membrane protein required for colicin V production
VIVLVLGFAVRGFFRGLVQEIFAVIGVLAGLWLAGVVSQWVGAHWQGAQPAAAFWVLRWLLMAFAGLAVATLFRWWGAKVGEAARRSPMGWMDRPAGVLVGVAVGLLIVTFVLLGALLAPWPSRIALTASRMRVAAPLMTGGVQASGWLRDRFPGGEWLRRRFLAAQARAERLEPRT